MTHKDFLYSVQKACQLDNTQSSLLLNSLCRLMSQAGVEQVPVTISGLGTFQSHKHPEYIQTDPKTGQQTLFPPRITYRLHLEDDKEIENAVEESKAPVVLAQQLAEQAKVNEDVASTFLVALSQTIVSKLEEGEEVEVHGLGSFRVVDSRQGEIHRIAYTPDEQMRQAVNAPFACFEPVVISSPSETATAAISIEEPQKEEEICIAVEKNVSVDAQEPIEDRQSVAEEVPVPNDDEIEASAVLQEPISVEQKVPEEPVQAISPTQDDERREPQAKAEPISIAEHYQDFADENKKTPVIRLLSILLILACAALAWFIFKLDRGDSQAYYDREIIENAAIQSSQPSDTLLDEGTEVFFGENEEVITEDIEPLSDADQQDAMIAAQEAAAKAEADRLAAEKAAAEKAAAEKLVAEKAAEEKAKAEKLAEQKAAADKKALEQKASEKKQESSTQNAIHGRLKNADGSYVTHKLSQGGRLTLVALEHYGDKAFWPYVFEVNRDKLKNPSLVQPGMVLYLPDPAVFGIDANNPESVAKAKAKARQYIQQ